MHNTPVAATPKAFDLTSSAFLLVAFLTGIAGALQTPTLSLFLTDEVHARPGMVGFFFTGSAVIGILVSQFLAGRSDKKGDRKNLIVFCCVLGMLACVLFAWNRNYFILLFVGVIPQQLSVRPPTANVCSRPRARRPYGSGSRHVQLDITCAGFAGLGDWPAAGLRSRHGV